MPYTLKNTIQRIMDQNYILFFTGNSQILYRLVDPVSHLRIIFTLMKFL